MSTAASGASQQQFREVVSRIERLPVCSWHTKMRLIFGTAWFFDAFDSLAIAYVLPVLIGMWKLEPGQIGQLIAIGFAGQLIGSIGAGWLAERWGRVPTAIVTLLIFTVMSFACAFAWSYQSLFWFRFLQGLGLGGEVPVMAAYVNEFAKAEKRGRFSLGIQILFAIGLPAVALVGLYVVPNWGWQWMFIIGAVPALIALPMRRLLPESPRWLASRGRFEEADRSLKKIEDIAVAEGKTLPPLPTNLPGVQAVEPRFADLFKGLYAKRTLVLWAVWICAYIITYGLTTWAPSLFRTVYKLPLQQSLTYGFILSGVALVGAFACVFLIDPLGRRRLFMWGLFLGSLPLLYFLHHVDRSAQEVLVLICTSFLFTTVLALGLATYTAESYPNHLRALGGGVAGAWQRGASMLGPLLVGFIIPRGGADMVFVTFGLFALVGAILLLVAGHETRGRVLEEVSPPA
jgi:MFS transporter, putative metabolite:H+ symporter